MPTFYYLEKLTQSGRVHSFFLTCIEVYAV